MPPPDYNRVKKIVPKGGIAQAPMTPEERAALEQMKASREPWLDYIGRTASEVGQNLYNTGMGFLPTALGGRGDIGVSDLVVGAVQGAGQTASGVADMMSGRIPVYDPADPRRPNPKAVEIAFDAASYFTGASAAAPSPDDALRAGAKSHWRKTPKTEGLPDLIRETDPETGQTRFYVMSGGVKKELDAQTAGRLHAMGAKLHNPFRKRPPTDAPMPDKETMDAWKPRYLERKDSSLNTGLGGFVQRGMQALRSPEGGGMGHNGGPPMEVDKRTLRANPANPEGSFRAAKLGPDGFYSKAEELLAENPQKVGLAQEFVKFLENKGAKKEVQYLGLDRLQGRMTKEEIIKLIQERSPQFEAVPTTHFNNYSVKVPGAQNYEMKNITWANADPGVKYEYPVHHLPMNTLFHNRYTHAVDPETGENILIKQEAQSDWAQQGDGNWKGTPFTPNDMQALTFTPRQIADRAVPGFTERDYLNMEDHFRYTYSTQENPDKEFTAYKIPGQRQDLWMLEGPGSRSAEEIYSRQRELWQRAQDEGSYFGPDNAIQERFDVELNGMDRGPFVTEGSSGWVPLSVRDAFMTAAQNGQTKIYVVPGTIHAKRWAGGGSRTQEGLKGFYDDVYYKEAKAELKSIQKDYKKLGVPAELVDQMKMEVKNPPWMKYENEGRNSWAPTPENNPLTWLHSSPREDLRPVMPDLAERMRGSTYRPHDMLAAIPNVLDDVYYYTGKSIEDTLEEADFEKLRLKRREDIQEAENDIVYYTQLLENAKQDLEDIKERLARDPNNQETIRWLESQERKVRQREQRVQDSVRLRDNRKADLPIVDVTKEFYDYWFRNVRRTGGVPQEPGEATIVFTVPQEMHEYIKKNGFNRFNRGGIVDTSVMRKLTGSNYAFA